MSKPEQTPLTFYAADWVELTKAFLQIMSHTRRRDLALHCINRDLHNGSLTAALVKILPDGKEIVTLLTPSDWQHRTVKAPLRPEEGVRVEPPYEDGYVYVRAVDLNKDYPLPGTSTMSAAHQSDDVRSAERRAADAAGKPKRQSLRQEMLEAILDRCYPHGVPENTSTSAVEQQVADAWKADCQERGLKPTEPPKWDTISRKLGRRRD